MKSLVVPVIHRRAQLLATVLLLVLASVSEPALCFSVGGGEADISADGQRVSVQPQQRHGPLKTTTLTRTPRTRRPSKVCSCLNDDECCVQWETYNIETWDPDVNTLNNHSVIGTAAGQVACRVLLQDDDEDDEVNPNYEFGAVNLSKSSLSSSSSSPPVCVLATDNASYEHFDVAVRNEKHCDTFHWAHMAFDVDPLGPNIVKVGFAKVPRGNAYSDDDREVVDIGICKCKDPITNNEYIGRMYLQGKHFGHCGYRPRNSNREVFVGGKYEALNGIRKKETQQLDEESEDENYLWKEAMDRIQKRIHLYLSPQDKQLIESISRNSLDELIKDLNNPQITSYQVLSRILSTDRFIPHDTLNTKGLSLLRAVLAEQMTLARRRYFGMHHHPDTAAWERDGVLLKDFDYYAVPANQHELEELLQMVAASPSISVAELGDWVERNVTSIQTDPQLEPHIDTFHSVVKMWVYERGVVTNETGPLHFMRGSNRNTRQKLDWIYNVCLPPATEATKEPSIRFHRDPADMIDDSMDGVLRPVLPQENYRRTLIIADTSGIHHRGTAVPGTVRRTIRLSSGNDGGLPRLNPYIWDGWEDAHGTETNQPYQIAQEL